MMIRLNRLTRTARLGGRLLTAAVLLSLGTWTAPAFSEDIEEEINGRYTYIRALDGDAELINRDGDEESDAITNYPVLTGDRIETDDDTFIDIVLSDGTQLTLGEETELLFENLSGSPDGLSDDEGTLLQLLEGEALVRVGLVRTSAYYPVIDTANARIYIQADGVYRIDANDHDFTEVAVLEGSVQVLTQTDEVLLNSGEAASFDGYADPYVARLRANWDEEIVHWSESIESRYSRGSSSVLDTPLSGTAHLDDSGDWVTVDTGRAWRPRVEATWRPYYRGRWAHTPSGLYWVSYDPWLPVTYRYGLWDLHPIHGWLWHPGYRYRTAHVYWYWGTDYAGWFPSGYYNRYYRNRYAGFGFRAGVLGWAGTYWDPFYDWTFCPTRYIGYRNSYRHYERGRHLHDRGVRLGRGIIATSTRGVGRDDWKRPALVSAALERGWRRDERNRDLPDVSGLVSRGDLTPEVRDTFVVERIRRGGTAEGTAASVNRSGRVATTIRDDATVPDASSRGAVSTRSRDVGGDRRVVRRSDTPSRVPSVTRGSTGSPSSRGAVRRSDAPAAPTASGSTRDRGTTSTRGAVPREGGTVSRSSSPARRVIDGAGSRGSSTSRSATPARRPPAATSGSSGSSTRSRSATPARPPTARSSSGSSSSRARTSTPPPRRPSSASSSSGRSSTRSSPPSTGTRRSTPPPSRSRASSPPPRRSSGSSSTRKATPPPSRSSASSSASSRRTPNASARSSASRPSASRSSSGARSSSNSRAASGPSTRPSAAPSRASASRSASRSSSTTTQRSRSAASTPRTSTGPSTRRSSASPSRSSSSPRASASSSRAPSRSTASRPSGSSTSSSRSTATRSSAKRKPPGL